MTDNREAGTPTPWRVANKHPRNICDERGFLIAKCAIKTFGANFEIPVEEAEANARKIVHRVNTYSDVVEALRYVRRFLRSEDVDLAYVDGVLSKAEMGDG